MPFVEQYNRLCSLWLCFQNTFEHGAIGFYDQYGNLLSMYRSTIGGIYCTKYTDLVYNPDNEHLGLTGVFIDQFDYGGYLFHEYDLTQPVPTPVTSVSYIRTGYTVEAKAIAYDPNSNPNFYYYISGSNMNTGELFLSQTNLSGSITPNEYLFPTNNINIMNMMYLRVTDNCINYPDRLGVTGYCADVNGNEQGFLADIDISSPGVIDFSIWPGFNPPIPFPFNQANFQHIVYRDNMAVNPNYSYILYGLPENPFQPYSYIAEYYPDPNFNPCLDIHDIIGFPSNPTLYWLSDEVIPDPVEDIVPDYSQSFPEQILQIECDPPTYAATNYHKDKRNISLTNRIVINTDNGFLVLNADYTEVSCNIYNVNGQLMAVKKKGQQIIKTSDFKPGIYILQPKANYYLKAVKFIITE